MELQAAIRDKNKNTKAHFRADFLGHTVLRRLDADIKNKELVNILAFYFDRANRYKVFLSGDQAVLPVNAVEGFRRSLEAVEASECEVSFRYFGYIFNSSSLKEEEKVVFQGRS